MSLIILCVGSATFTYTESARAQFFEGCGVLYITHPEECLAFLPDSGEFPGGLLGDWGGFQDGDRVLVSGVVEIPKCGTFCNVIGCFLDGNTVDVCPAIIPTVSEWGMIALGLLVLVGGTIMIRTGKWSRCSVSVFGVFFACLISTILGCNVPGKHIASPGSKSTANPATASGIINPHRQARFQNAIRGLSFDHVTIERAENWQNVIAEEINGEDVPTLMSRADDDFRQFRDLDALRNYKLAVLLDPQTTKAHLWIGNILSYKGKTDMAMCAYNTVLSQNPESTDALYYLSYIYWNKNNPQKSLSLLREILTL